MEELTPHPATQPEAPTVAESSGTAPEMAPAPGTSVASPAETVPSLAERKAAARTVAQVAAKVPDAEAEMRRISRRSFLWAGVTGVVAYSGWRWLITREDDDGIPWPFRRVLDLNADLARDYFSGSRLAPTFPLAQATVPQQNGDDGLSDGFDPSTWKLAVTGLASGNDLSLTLDDLKAFPHQEMVTEFKCIEGWSYIVHWGGVRFADFMKKYPPATQDGNPPDVANNPGNLVQYVGMMTPDQGYYVSLDMKSALHPQTLLCYELDGKPLPMEHGAPLRLVIPVKYGVKHIKRIGTITYAAERPADYWAERGYDWYAGH